MNIVGQCEGPCYKNNPCKECRNYLTIKYALNYFVGNELKNKKGLERQVATNIDSPKMGECLIPHSSTMVAEKQNVELLFWTLDIEIVSEVKFPANISEIYIISISGMDFINSVPYISYSLHIYQRKNK